ncbi:olfactory receptor 6F1-like [Aquarana catesbeiana]|uniref:olfactory receptor 6F1-like n=1 Tax=Aquarana catesbeiana TaxID=8400 RepID=UPI003CCA5F62
MGRLASGKVPTKDQLALCEFQKLFQGMVNKDILIFIGVIQSFHSHLHVPYKAFKEHIASGGIFKRVLTLKGNFTGQQYGNPCGLSCWVNTLTIKHKNKTVIPEFLLIGFSIQKKTQFCLFIIICIAYGVTMTANVFIIIMVKTERRLNKPMCFFISVLSFIEIWYPSVSIPRLLWSLKTTKEAISPVGCIIQFYFHFSLGATEIFLLTVMAYDRYVAVCNPLRHMAIINPKVCTILMSGVCGFVSMITPCVQIANLSFCRENQIDHYYCDLAPILKWSCSETSSTEKLFFCFSLFIILGCFFLIVISYICIIRTTLMFPTAIGRRKTFSTFALHLIVVLLFYRPIIFMFTRPSTGGLMHLNKIVSIIPLVVTPLLNPIIYTLCNQEVHIAMKKTIQRFVFPFRVQYQLENCL